jgi:D-alanyl-D-alanine carboxypeptidase
MTSNSKFHLQSILFAVVVLMFAMFSSNGQEQAAVAEAPREVQLTATVVDAVPEVFTGEGMTEAGTQDGGDKVEVFAAHEAAALDSEPAPSTQTAAASVVASAFLVKEVGSDEEIGAYQADYRWPIASITKLMTAVVALEKIGPDQGVIISQAAIDTEGDSGGFTAGEEFSVTDLITAMMTVSSNDAAAAIADYVGTPRFFDLMQEKAYELKMTETSFIDATGLSYLNQSTAQDISILVEYVYQHYPEVLKMSTRATNKITEQASRLSRTLKNINAFAGTTGFEGGKTGFTEESRGNLVSLFNYQGKTYTLVVFGTADRFAETRKLFAWLKTTLAEKHD